MPDTLTAAVALYEVLPRCQNKDRCSRLATRTDSSGRPAYCEEHGGGLPTGWGDEALTLEEAITAAPEFK